MNLDVVGSGSAFSIRNNTSAIRITDNHKNQWLIDCGPTIPRALWSLGVGVNDIKVIYFTHVHPDHCSGLAALLNQWKSFNRSQPLDIYCQFSQIKILKNLVELAIWPELEICFEIHWHDISDRFDWKNWKVETAYTQHEISNRALRITVDEQVLFYSGDGRSTLASRKLMENADVAFQECASFDALPEDSSHGDFPSCIKLAKTTGVQLLGVYHCADSIIPKIEEMVADTENIFLSSDGLHLDLNELNVLRQKRWD